MSESKSETDCQDQVETLESVINEQTKTVTNAKEELVDIARKINGWDPNPDRSLQVNIQSMSTALFGVIEAKNTRIQNLQLKLGQLVERGP